VRNGLGDEFNVRDARSAARTAMTATKDMYRALFDCWSREVTSLPTIFTL
jgi:hypothetical protein